ncbi:MAG: hypothetical protein LBH85_02815 [Treponema sp.]|jgi:hypothetical protein|nr:hypothetical protein [Treponema sp.]
MPVRDFVVRLETFIMENGFIEDNAALGYINSCNYGGGVYLAGGRFPMSGETAIDAGNPVYLGRNAYISLSGSLAANPAANIDCSPNAE